MKTCARCARALDLSEFSFRSRPGGTRTSYCKRCQSSYCRRYYSDHREEHNARRYKHQKRYRICNRERLHEFLSGKACVDCAESDPVVLELDHIRGPKRGNISQMVSNGVTWARIADELKKCEIRCANCHRRKTAREFQWSKTKIGM